MSSISPPPSPNNQPSFFSQSTDSKKRKRETTFPTPRSPTQEASSEARPNFRVTPLTQLLKAQSENSMVSFLSIDLILKTLSFLDYRSILKAQQLCTALYQIGTDAQLRLPKLDEFLYTHCLKLADDIEPPSQRDHVLSTLISGLLIKKDSNNALQLFNKIRDETTQYVVQWRILSFLARRNPHTSYKTHFATLSAVEKPSQTCSISESIDKFKHLVDIAARQAESKSEFTQETIEEALRVFDLLDTSRQPYAMKEFIKALLPADLEVAYGVAVNIKNQLFQQKLQLLCIGYHAQHDPETVFAKVNELYSNDPWMRSLSMCVVAEVQAREGTIESETVTKILMEATRLALTLGSLTLRQKSKLLVKLATNPSRDLSNALATARAIEVSYYRARALLKIAENQIELLSDSPTSLSEDFSIPDLLEEAFQSVHRLEDANLRTALFKKIAKARINYAVLVKHTNPRDSLNLLNSCLEQIKNDELLNDDTLTCELILALEKIDPERAKNAINEAISLIVEDCRIETLCQYASEFESRPDLFHWVIEKIENDIELLEDDGSKAEAYMQLVPLRKDLAKAVIEAEKTLSESYYHQTLNSLIFSHNLSTPEAIKIASLILEPYYKALTFAEIYHRFCETQE